jgi:hypothetical protein
MDVHCTLGNYQLAFMVTCSVSFVLYRTEEGDRVQDNEVLKQACMLHSQWFFLLHT